MKKIERLDEKKKIALNILIEIDKFCKNNDIQYCLAYGTLLGCIRHKGYIPWDDDIDLWMKREYYEKFIEKFSEFSKTSVFKINSYRTINNYDKTFIQIYDSSTKLVEDRYNNLYELGIFIDIFPLDGLPNNKIIKQLYIKRLQFLKLLLIVKRIDIKKVETTNFKKGILRFTKSMLRINNYTILNLYEKHAKKYSYISNEYFHTVPTGDSKSRGKGLIIKADLFDEYTESLFEGQLFPVPVGFEGILSKIYGDFMTLPPLDCRNPHHEYEAFYK